MKNQKLILTLLLISISSISCSIFKRTDARVIKGNYRTVIKTNEIDSAACELVCIVFDKESNRPIDKAILGVLELDIGGFTDSNGIYKAVIPPGKYTIKVFNTGNTEMQTKPIKFKAGSRTEIKLELGNIVLW